MGCGGIVKVVGVGCEGVENIDVCIFVWFD